MSILHPIGALVQPDGSCHFHVWAPQAESINLEISEPEKRSIPMEQTEYGYWFISLTQISAETRYTFKINNETERPDPASFFQPEGVHKASAVVNHHAFSWTDQNWQGIPLEELIIYELHTGTFTEQQSFEGIISKLNYLIDLGINAIEIMPVAQFPGNRNWGYDGVYPFAVQDSYGGPEGLKKLVDACHKKGISVVLDVVYNHMGPEGNYLNNFGPYFTDKYKTPWGSALNFDDSNCDGVRNFFIQNALMWLRDYHIDALRLDAVHAIMDFGAHHFLQELSEEVTKLSGQTGREYILIAESDLNDVRMVNPKEKGGYGMDAQWNDDFHHALHALVTGERAGYYADFGRLEDLAKAFQEAFVFNGNYAPHRRKSYGNSAAENEAKQFVVCAQNHDQVGNRMPGDRLSETLSVGALKLVAATYLLSPFIPMLFMGEEYGEKNPFQYFISHTDKELVKAVQEGRKNEFKSFKYAGEVPDPQSEETFWRSMLSWKFETGEAAELHRFYKTLIGLRKNHPVFRHPDKKNMKVTADGEKKLLTVERWNENFRVRCLYNLSKETVKINDAKNRNWKLLLNSASEKNLPVAMNFENGNLEIAPLSVIILETHE